VEGGFAPGGQVHRPHGAADGDLADLVVGHRVDAAVGELGDREHALGGRPSGAVLLAGVYHTDLVAIWAIFGGLALDKRLYIRDDGLGWLRLLAGSFIRSSSSRPPAWCDWASSEHRPPVAHNREC
jgi:hypothetical protein